MKRLSWIAWLIVVHLAAGLLLYQNRDTVTAALAPVPTVERPPAHYRYLRRAHATIDAFVEPGAVIFIGDSITEGLNTLAVAPNSVNYGISNDTTRGVLARLDDYASLDRAAIVVLAIGVNDLVRREVDATLADYRGIVERLGKTTPLLLAPALPVDETAGWPGLNTKIAAFNRQIARIAAGEAHISVVDLGTAFADAEGNLRDELHTDGVHLGPEGYRMWITALKSAISKISITK